ncbi:muconolactone Delta-isomerase [Geodermatophilus sp. DSM 44513]|uniref:muconolactone Delta-isomerase n=1 Tax=Geodermatophilus sp. DSM 44513 TaxID=1528104 RepID=UPI0012842B1D|nr:muconolactone Delta-isomerase [Geodermatophilus sp. DSM 44513]WNV77067.1 muconolactone Delta-isomerase [Geodermatophilus sp. DSM 44513]
MSQLYAVRMDVALPPGMDPAAREDLLARERAYSQQWQRSGHWPHIWRCVGQYANLSVFAVDSNEQLHEILWGLPLFPYMSITVTPLAPHPSDIAQDPAHGHTAQDPAHGDTAQDPAQQDTAQDPAH